MTNFLLSPNSFFLIAGPCALESEESVMYLSSEIKKITDRLGINYCFKVSWDKANRTSVSKWRGLGLEEGIRILKEAMPEGTRFLKREKWLDGDLVKAKDTYTAFLNDVDADIYVALLTTAPFVKKETLQNSLDKVLSGEYDSAFAAKRLQTFAWFQGRPLNYRVEDVPRTQDLEPVYAETSAFFIFTRRMWMEHSRRIGFRPYIQEVDDIEEVDIDTMDDLRFAQMIAGQILHI